MIYNALNESETGIGGRSKRFGQLRRCKATFYGRPAMIKEEEEGIRMNMNLDMNECIESVDGWKDGSLALLIGLLVAS